VDRARTGALNLLRYRGGQGQWAWLLHRTTGLGIVLFVGLHVFDIWLIGLGREPFERFLVLYRSPPARILEVFLLFGVLFHALNGLRIVLMDVRPGLARRRRTLLRVEAVLLLAILLPAVWLTVRGLP
jgi:succinate dehydrogenase / fumarate reductase cytochrome b subunit